MRVFIPALFVCLCCAQIAQPQAGPAAGLPNLPENTVIAVFDDGVKFTMGDFAMMLAAQPPQNQQMAKINSKAFIQWWAGMRKLAQTAEQEKLDQESSVKAQLDYYRIMLLGQTKLNRTLNTIMPADEEVQRAYDAAKDRYKQVKVKAIYIAYGDAVPSGKKPMTEQEAKSKADKLLAEIRKGADFVQLVRENSDDETSRDKEGDFATFGAKDNIPEAIRKAVFALKQGEVTEPVSQPNGFYLLKAAEINVVPLDKVRSELIMEIRQQQYASWLKQHNDNLKVEFPNPAFPVDPTAPAAK